MRAHGRSTAVAVFVGVALIAGACSDGDDSGGSGQSGGSGGSGASGEGLETIAGALAAVPESREESETVLWGDMARAAELAGLERPDDPGDTDAVVDYVQSLTTGRIDADTTSPVLVLPPEAAGVDRVNELDAFADEVGWSILDVDRFIERQTEPDVVTVLEGGFQESAMSEALGEPSDGLWVAGHRDAGEFEIDIADRTVARPLGESLWLGLDGNRLAVARSRDSAEAARGNGSEAATLADDEAFAALGAALDAEDPYAAMLVRPGLAIDPVDMRATPEQADALCDVALPEATTGVATGLADDDGPVYLVALAHDSSAAAAANAEAFEDVVASGTSAATREPWSDMVTLDGVEVTGDDRVVVARLRPTETGPLALWYQVLIQRDSLVGYC
jgi:hypothetical protein